MTIGRGGWIAALAVVALAAVPVSAQAGGADDQALQPITPQDFVTAATQSNRFEIESSRLVRNTSRNRDVRRIARELIRDHTSQQRELAALAAQLGLQVPASGVNSTQQSVLQRIRSRSRGPQRDRAYLRAQVLGHAQAIVVFQRVILTATTPAPLRQAATLTLPVLGMHLGEVTLASSRSRLGNSGSHDSGADDS